MCSTVRSSTGICFEESAIESLVGVFNGLLTMASVVVGPKIGGSIGCSVESIDPVVASIVAGSIGGGFSTVASVGALVAVSAPVGTMSLVAMLAASSD